MNYQKELNYLNNIKAQFDTLEFLLRKAKKEGKKTINLKKIWHTKKNNQ